MLDQCKLHVHRSTALNCFSPEDTNETHTKYGQISCSTQVKKLLLTTLPKVGFDEQFFWFISHG